MKYYLTYSEFVNGRLINGTGHVLKKYDNHDDAVCYAQAEMLDFRENLGGKGKVYVSDAKNYFRLRHNEYEYVFTIFEGD